MEAAATGRWPERVDEDLRAHVSACAICADVAEIAPLFVAERDAAWQEADPPPASAVFWRAQMRVRREAAAQAARPMVLVQRAALAYAGVALFGLGVLLGPWIGASARAVVGVLRWLTPNDDGLVGLAMSTSTGLLPIAGLMLLLVLAPVVLYFALADR
jgi:hypothetical protein